MAVAAQIDFQVIPYSAAALADALSTDWVTRAEVEAKDHYVYLREYLADTGDGLAARTMVVEHPYVSQSYLTDYASYFALGFQAYERFCRRVHFFSKRFSRTQLQAALTAPAKNGAAQRIWDAYLGCVVVKPLPRTPIGATLLRPYPSRTDRVRHYPACRQYEVNLLGKTLPIPTLIFQEQDLVVSACATTALWIAFHKTAELFRTVAPSPYQITSAAKNLFNSTGRTFPNDGLDHYQIGNAIESTGLVTEMLHFDSWRQLEEPVRAEVQALHEADLFLTPDEEEEVEALVEAGEAESYEAAADALVEEKIEEKVSAAALRQMRRYKRIIYAYLHMGLPVLLFIKSDGADSEHLVTATGYCEAPHSVRRTDEISCVAEQLERLYVHDDQLGPFARFGFTDEGQLDTKCAAPGGEATLGQETATLLTLFVPLSAEIRITYDQVFEPVQAFDALLYDRIGNPQDVVWDIYLSTSNAYKTDLLEKDWVEPKVRRDMAARLLPKYVWIARAFLGTIPLLELLFDATDLHTGSFCLDLTWYNTELKQEMTDWLADDDNRRASIATGPLRKHWRYLDLLLDSLSLPLTGNAPVTQARRR